MKIRQHIIILDSCILMLPSEKRINLSKLDFLPFSYILVVPEIVIEELTKLSQSDKTATKRKAKLALLLAEKYERLSSRMEGHVDTEIIRLAKQHKAIVATTDSELRRKLRNEGIPVITLRGKNELKLIGEVVEE
ncbi:MAG: type II toxin-antitoxin system VapC family toxin [Candidatus Heimdallarchaeaceae archaeon]